MMRDDFKRGDLAFIYHSRTDVPGIVGIAEVVKEAYPDHTALDPKSKYFDSKSKEKGESRWCMVDVKAVKRFKEKVSLATCREVKDLSEMALLKKGQRLSIQPVSAKEWKAICALGSPKKI